MKFSKGIMIGALASFAALAGAALFRAPAALADTGAGTSAVAGAVSDCSVTAAQIAQIAVIQQDPSFTPSEEITQELALRKLLVGETITCAETQVEQLQTALQAVSTTDPVGQNIQSQLGGDLNGALSYYNNELQRLSTSGIAGTEAIATEVLAWRQGTFVAESENVNNFILWAGNQSIFDTAQTRMDQTQRAVSFLEDASQNTDLQNAFDAAVASFNDAESENQAARSALAGQLSPDQSLTLIKQSLASLSTTYQDFFTISTLINSILPQ